MDKHAQAGLCDKPLPDFLGELLIFLGKGKEHIVPLALDVSQSVFKLPLFTTIVGSDLGNDCFRWVCK